MREWNRQAQVRRARGRHDANSRGRPEQKKSRALQRTNALQQTFFVRWLRTASRCVDGCEDCADGFVHTLRRSGDCEFVSGVAKLSKAKSILRFAAQDCRALSRSEERRVGKEWRIQLRPHQSIK